MKHLTSIPPSLPRAAALFAGLAAFAGSASAQGQWIVSLDGTVTHPNGSLTTFPTIPANPSDGAADQEGIYNALVHALSIPTGDGEVIIDFPLGTYVLREAMSDGFFASPAMLRLKSTNTPQVARKITLRGNGARIEVVSSKNAAGEHDNSRLGIFSLNGYHDLTFQDLDFDYVYKGHQDYPPGTPSAFSQTVVREVNNLSTVVTTQAGFRVPLEAPPYDVVFSQAFEPASESSLEFPGLIKRRARQVNRVISQVETIVPGLAYRLHHQAMGSNSDVQVGDTLAIPQAQDRNSALNTTYDRTSRHAFDIRHCDRVIFEGVNLMASPYMGFVLDACAGVHFRNCSIAPYFVAKNAALVNRPSIVPPYSTTGPRPDAFFSASRDGIHVVQHRGPLIVEDSTICYIGDDAIALKGYYFKLDATPNANNPTSVTLRSNLSPGILREPAVGDRLRFLVGPDAAGEFRSEERTILSAGAWTHTGGSLKAVVELDRATSALGGDLVEGYDSVGIGTIIRRNRIFNTGSRGMILRTHGATIEDNVVAFTEGPGLSLDGVQLSNGQLVSTVSAGSFANVILGNRFDHCAQAQLRRSYYQGALAIYSWVPISGLPDLHRRNIVRSNVFRNSYGGAIFASNASNTVIAGNTFEGSFEEAVTGVPTDRPYTNPLALVNLDGCVGTIFSGNTVLPSTVGGIVDRHENICSESIPTWVPALLGGKGFNGL